MDSAIRFEQIEKSYRQGERELPALRGVSAEIDRGECVALCGPSGSGKSTLLNIGGLLDSDYRGELHLEDQRVNGDANENTRRRRDRLGFIFQHFNLMPVMTAAENVGYPLLLNDVPAAERRQRVSELLEKVGLAEFAEHRPDRLSGGQRQRIAVARALIKRPGVVIADEPTASLDTVTANQVIDLMRELGREQGISFLIATHDERMTARCDRVLHLLDGVIQREDS